MRVLIVGAVTVKYRLNLSVYVLNATDFLWLNSQTVINNSLLSFINHINNNACNIADSCERCFYQYIRNLKSDDYLIVDPTPYSIQISTNLHSSDSCLTFGSYIPMVHRSQRHLGVR